MRIMSMVRDKINQRKALVQERKTIYDDEYKKQIHKQNQANARSQAQQNAKRDAANIGNPLIKRIAANLKEKSKSPKSAANTLFTQSSNSSPFTSSNSDNPFYSKKK